VELERLSPAELTSRLNRFIEPSDLFVNLAYWSAVEAKQADVTPAPREKPQQRADVQRSGLNNDQQDYMRNWAQMNQLPEQIAADVPPPRLEPALSAAQRSSALIAAALQGGVYVAPLPERTEDIVFVPMAVPVRDESGVFAVLSRFNRCLRRMPGGTTRRRSPWWMARDAPSWVPKGIPQKTRCAAVTR
jgi:hypothetical protein